MALGVDLEDIYVLCHHVVQPHGRDVVGRGAGRCGSVEVLRGDSVLLFAAKQRWH